MWTGQKMLDLGRQAPLNGINDSGQIAGTYGTNNSQIAGWVFNSGVSEGFSYSNGTLTNPGPPRQHQRGTGAGCAALINAPRLLVLDEPTVGLDPIARGNVWEYILRLRDEHDMTVLMTTHYMDEADAYCDRVSLKVWWS